MVVHRESASAAAKGGVWFSRKATLALVGACGIFSYAAHASSSGATASLGAFFRAPGAPGGSPGFGGHGDPRAASTELLTQTLRGKVGELEGQMHALSRDNDVLRAEVERLGADNARLSDLRDREDASDELVSCQTELGALRAKRAAAETSRSAANADGSAETRDENASVGQRNTAKRDDDEDDKNTAASSGVFASAEHPECDETMYGARGAGYRGCQSVTRSGLTCQSWSAQTPHQHAFDEDEGFFSRGGESAADAKNHCRNPDGGDSIWCYTTDPNIRFDYCDPRPVGWDYFCAHEGEELCECAKKNDGGSTVVVAARYGDDAAGTEMDWESAVASGAFAAAKRKPGKAISKKNLCDVDELGVDPSPGVAKACWCAPKDALPSSVAEEGVSDADADADADVAPAPAPALLSSEMDAEEEAEFARFVDALAEAPGAFPAVREPETLERAVAEVEKRAAKKNKSRGQKKSPRRIDAAESSSDYESFSGADGSPIDPFEAFEAHEDLEPFDPLAFTDAPSGYEALPPVAEKAIARDVPTRRERLAEWEKHFDDHYVDDLRRRFDDDADFADAPEPSSDSSDADADAFVFERDSSEEDDSEGSDGSGGYPGTRGCEKTCEGADVSESKCASMFFCRFDEKDRRCWSAVGAEPCPATREEMFALWDEKMKEGRKGSQ